MDLLYDFYYKNQPKDTIKIKKFTSIIETYSELKEEFYFLDHKIELLDISRDFKDRNNRQRLKLQINQAIPKELNGWSHYGIVDDITSILSLITGRIFIPSEDFIIYTPEKDIYHNHISSFFKSQRNLTIPIQNVDLPSEINEILINLFTINTEEDIKKYRAIQRALKSYRNSLWISIQNINVAYLLLISSAEVLGAEFSRVKLSINNIENYNEIHDLIEKYNYSNKFENALYKILFKSRNLKLQAKFINVISNNIRNDFFTNKPKIYVPLVGKAKDVEGQLIHELKGFEEEDADFLMKEEELPECLKNLYQCRSQFVHDAIEWPDYANLGDRDLFRPIETDQYGNAKRNEDGKYKLKKPIPSYFWFERVMNSVIKNIIVKFGNKEL